MPGLPVGIASALARYRVALLFGTMLSALVVPQLVSALEDTSSNRSIQLAETEADKKKKEPPKKAPPPPPPPKAPPPPPPPKAPPPPPPKAPPPPPPKAPPPVQQKTFQQEQKKFELERKKFEQKKFDTGQPPKSGPKQDAGPPIKKFEPKKFEQKTFEQRKFEQKKFDAGQPPKFAPKQTETPPPKFDPKGKPKFDPDTARKGPKFDPDTAGKPKFDPKFTGKDGPKFAPKTGDRQGLPPVGVQTFGKPKPPAGPRFESVNQVRGQRKEIRDGNRLVIVEPGNRRIIRDGKRLIIRHDDGDRLRRFGNARFEVRGRERYTTVRRGGFEIVSISDANGRLLRRFRRGPDGREYVLIDNRRRGLGFGAAVVGVTILAIVAPRILIPRNRYIVDTRDAPPELLYETLVAPPEAPPERFYTLDEIRDNVELRAYTRSVDINTITFATGSWEVSPDQIPQLQALAEAMLRVIEETPTAVFLLEGHTDLVGNPEDNLSLSDRRAESVAEILTSSFQVPPENIVTQGFGEQHPRVQTEGPSPENRRVVVRNITGLLGQDGGGKPPPGGPPGKPEEEEEPEKPGGPPR